MTEIGVVTTHLARTDRRALSQAWYDAFFSHCAGPAARPASRPQRSPERAAGSPPKLQRESARCETLPPRAAVRSVRATTGGPIVVERRAPADRTVERIARAVVRLTRARRFGACAVALGGGRVHLIVRGDAAGMRIVAVCAAADRERVARALAAARFAAAGAGIAVAA